MKSSVLLQRSALLATKIVVLSTVSLVGMSTACGKGEDAAATKPVTRTGNDAAKPKTPDPGKKVPKAKPRGPERSVYSLIDNRLSAHVQRSGGVVAVGGSAGFVKYLRYGKSKMPWQIRQTRAGKKVAVMGGKTAALQIPLTSAQAKGATLRMRVHNGNDRALTVRVNGKQKQEITRQMKAGWSTVVLELPGDAVRVGENQILIFTGKGEPMALEWLQVGGGDPGEAAPALYDTGKKSLVLPENGGLVYYVMVPEKGLLTGDLGDAACSVAVSARDESGGEVTGELVGQGSAVNLARLAGKPVRLELTGRGCPVAHLAGAALKVPGTEPAKSERGPAPKYVVFWIMDSLRADRVRPFNPKARAETPNFEKLAKTGAAFRQAYVQGNESRVTHASIWSSLYPVKHNMISAKAKLAGKWKTIDEVAKGAGLFASGVSANGYVARKWGFGTAWNKYSNHIHEKKGLKGQDVYDKGIGTIDGKKDPWFLYLGTIDTHVSWRPKEPWMGKYHPQPYKGRFAKRFSGEDAGRNLTLSDAEIKWVRAMYDSNVSYQDELLGQLLGKLDEWGIADETMIIITADHGDEQWEHDKVGHGGSLRETLVHVPLLVHYPPMIRGGLVDEGAEVIDIVPTLADALGQKADKEWQGQSLIPIANGAGAGYPRMSMASMYERAHAARMGSWKLRIAGGKTPELYNVSKDPLQRKNIVAKHPITRRFLADPLWILRSFNMDWRKSAWGNAANVSAAFPASFGE